MDSKYKAVFIGTDERFVFAAEYMKKDGMAAFVLGRDGGAEAALSHADAVIFPLGQRGELAELSNGCAAVPDIVSKAKNAAFFGGAGIFSLVPCGRRYDLTKIETFAEKNADLTAEGVVGIMINSLPFSVCGAKVAVLGYGRIGSALAKKLCALGARVTVFARREESRAEAEKVCAARDFSDFSGGFDCVINTIPAKTVDEKIDPDAYVIELASAPFGFDENFRAKREDKFIYAPGLPGKTAPMSAGKAVFDAVSFILKGESEK